MSEPKRIQRKRTRGYRLPPGTICVSRPSKYGNPFAVRERVWNNTWVVVDTLDNSAPDVEFETKADAQAHAVARFVDYLQTRFLPLDDLRGHDLACWCALCDAHHKDGKPLGVECPDCASCHADMLMEIANGESRDDD